jgi:polysaccharide biosynthesis protein PslG
VPRRLRLTLLVATAAALLAAPAQAATNSLSAFGVGSLKSEWLAGYNGSDGLDPNGLFDLSLAGQSGLKLYRARFRQDQVKLNGAYTQWTMLDNLVRQAALRDVTIEPVLINMPGETYTPPLTSAARTDFGNFVTAAVKRYGPNGSYWPACGCTAHPIQVWEVWNEENDAPYWNPPSPSQYASLLTSVRSKLRAADPGARVLMGGLAYPSSPGPTKMEANSFLQQTIAAGGASSFDAVGVHVYASDPNRAVNTLVQGTVNTLKTFAGTSGGAPRQQVWVNEMARPTDLDDPATAADEAAASQAAQRDWLDQVLGLLLPKRASWNLGPVMWYALRDYKQPTSASLRYGLRLTNPDDTDAGAKLSWNDLAARAAAATPLALPALR